MSDSAQDKTLPATPQRLKKARDDGQVARSKDLLNLAVLGAGSAVLMLALPWAFGLLRDGLRGQLRFDRAAVVAPSHPLAGSAGTGGTLAGVSEALRSRKDSLPFPSRLQLLGFGDCATTNN